MFPIPWEVLITWVRVINQQADAQSLLFKLREKWETSCCFYCWVNHNQGGGQRGTHHFVYQEISWVVATCRRKNPSPQIFNSITSRLDKADSNPWLLAQLALKSFLGWKTDEERLEELVRMIKKEREWERSTWAALKDEGFYKVTMHFTCTRKAGRNRQASRTCSILVHCFSKYTEDNRDALYKYW